MIGQMSNEIENTKVVRSACIYTSAIVLISLKKKTFFDVQHM